MPSSFISLFFAMVPPAVHGFAVLWGDNEEILANEKADGCKQVIAGRIQPEVNDGAATISSPPVVTTTDDSPQMPTTKQRGEAAYYNPADILDRSDEIIESLEWTFKVDWDHREQLQKTLMSVMSSFGLKVEVRHNRDIIAEHRVLLEARLSHFLESSEASSFTCDLRGDKSYHAGEGSFFGVVASLSHRLDKAFSMKRESVSVYVEGTAEQLERAESWILAHVGRVKTTPN